MTNYLHIPSIYLLKFHHFFFFQILVLFLSLHIQLTYVYIFYLFHSSYEYFFRFLPFLALILKVLFHNLSVNYLICHLIHYILLLVQYFLFVLSLSQSFHHLLILQFFSLIHLFLYFYHSILF